MSRSMPVACSRTASSASRLRHAGERGRIHQLGDRRAADPRVGIVARDLREQFALLERNLLDEAQADRGVDVLLTGLGAETIEQCHRRSSLTRAGQLVKVQRCELSSDRRCASRATRRVTFLSMSRMRPSASDVDRPPRRHPARPEHTVRPRHLFRRIAQNRIVDPERRRKLRVGLRRIDARREIRDVEPPQRRRRSTRATCTPPFNRR